MYRLRIPYLLLYYNKWLIFQGPVNQLRIPYPAVLQQKVDFLGPDDAPTTSTLSNGITIKR